MRRCLAVDPLMKARTRNIPDALQAIRHDVMHIYLVRCGGRQSEHTLRFEGLGPLPSFISFVLRLPTRKHLNALSLVFRDSYCRVHTQKFTITEYHNTDAYVMNSSAGHKDVLVHPVHRQHVPGGVWVREQHYQVVLMT